MSRREHGQDLLPTSGKVAPSAESAEESHSNSSLTRHLLSHRPGFGIHRKTFYVSRLKHLLVHLQLSQHAHTFENTTNHTEAKVRLPRDLQCSAREGAEALPATMNATPPPSTFHKPVSTVAS